MQLKNLSFLTCPAKIALNQTYVHAMHLIVWPPSYNYIQIAHTQRIQHQVTVEPFQSKKITPLRN